MKYLNKLKTKELRDYARLLIENGFRVFVYKSKPKEKVSWIIISKNGNIGNISLNDFNGFRFSTIHKANSKTGTGYALNYYDSMSPTIENAEKTFIKYPEWAKEKDKNSIIKYKDIQEYLEKCYLKYLEITPKTETKQI